VCGVGSGDGRGECKVDVDNDEDVEGCGNAHGLVADVVMRCAGRVL
jgi:hypothetical protein